MTYGRELSDELIRLQAEALLDYQRRGGDETVWLHSKYFTRQDAYQIRMEARRIAQERRSA